ncbi:hypothetical protein WG66_008213 [Moniliophthora roreri]|nr:hypothetical protein WG66_008213 [Moniliophthora roreri]
MTNLSGASLIPKVGFVTIAPTATLPNWPQYITTVIDAGVLNRDFTETRGKDDHLLKNVAEYQYHRDFLKLNSTQEPLGGYCCVTKGSSTPLVPDLFRHGPTILII